MWKMLRVFGIERMKKIKTANTVYKIIAPFGMLRFIY
jgi:hypothetical protein